MGDNKNHKQRKRYKEVNCSSELCDCVINVDYAISVNDYDYIDADKTKIYVYCPKCGLQHIVKL